MNSIIPARRIRISNETIRVGLPLETMQQGSVRIIQDQANMRVLEFRCSCGKTMHVECEYSGEAAA